MRIAEVDRRLQQIETRLTQIEGGLRQLLEAVGTAGFDLRMEQVGRLQRQIADVRDGCDEWHENMLARLPSG